MYLLFLFFWKNIYLKERLIGAAFEAILISGEKELTPD